VAEGLAGVLKNVVEKNMVDSLEVGTKNVQVNMLQ